jgi:membrane associated rhomboid family serine protease
MARPSITKTHNGAMLLRLVPEFRLAMDLSLVLDAEGIAHELRSVAEEQWALVVDDADAARAEMAIAAFERENPPRKRKRAAPEPLAGGVAAGLIFGLSLLALHIWTGPDSPESSWFARGSAEAERILAGEWWRAITALTLHADAAHAAGNAVLGGLLLALLGRVVGAGVASWMVLLSGAAGTFLASALVRHSFVSVGASTAVFGALGALAAAQALDPEQRRRAWVPLGAGFALLAFLGTGKRADFAGHLCGFLAGVVLGFAAARLPRWQNRAAQAALALAAAAVPVAAWWRALR